MFLMHVAYHTFQLSYVVEQDCQRDGPPDGSPDGSSSRVGRGGENGGDRGRAAEEGASIGF